MKRANAALSIVATLLVCSGLSAAARQDRQPAGLGPSAKYGAPSSEPAALRQTGDDAPVFSLDDGTYEVALGIVEQNAPPRFGSQGVFLNRFTPDEDLLPFSVDTVLVLFPLSDPNGSTGLQSGQPFEILVYVDPSGSGNPANTQLAARKPISILPSNTLFQTVRLDTPVVVESGDVWLGFTNTVTATDEVPIYPAALDTNGAIQGRSWAFFNTEPGSHFAGGVLSAAEVGTTLNGNWLIRMSGQAGGLTSICWSPPSAARGDLPPPENTRFCGMPPPLPKDEGGGPASGQPPVRGYNVYRSNEPGVTPTPNNFFTSTGPDTTTVDSSVSPGGSFFVVTTVYDEGESGPSNEVAIVPPTVNTTKVKANKIVANGANFANVVVLIDGIPFATPPKIKRNGAKLVQKGPLVTGQTVFQYLDQAGGSARVVIRNANGAFASFDADK